MYEKAADAITDLYQENALSWVDLRGQTLFEQPWLDQFLALTLKGELKFWILVGSRGNRLRGILLTTLAASPALMVLPD